MNKVNSYKELLVWQNAMELVILVYDIVKTFPDTEKFGLVNQMTRAAVSIPANIAEGWGSATRKNYLQFLRISKGSIMELETLIELSNRLGFVEEGKLRPTLDKIETTSKLLQGLIKKLEEIELLQTST
jgi:four helix bundle protein